MKDLKEYIFEQDFKYTLKDLSVTDILKRISKGDYQTIRDHMEEEEEIDEDDDILYVNGRNTAKNVYTNLEKNSPYQWVALMNNSKEVAIQLLKFENQETIELVIAERSKKANNEHETFKKILDAVIEKYNPKEIHTFALADKLKEKYMSYGFEPDKEDQLTLKL